MGKNRHPVNFMNDFRKAIADCGLQDIGMKGHLFTWEKGRGTPNFMEERLDRALSTQSWLMKFPKAKVFNLNVTSSDHSSLILKFIEDRNPRIRRFRFENS